MSIIRLFIVLLLIVVPANAAEWGSCVSTDDCHIYVDTDVSAGGTGTSADPYNLFDTAEDAADGAFTYSGWTSGKNVYIHLRGATADNCTGINCDISGFSLDSDNQLIIMTDTVDTTPDAGWEVEGRNTGATWSTSFHRFEQATGDTDATIQVADNYVQFIGIQANTTGSSTGTSTINIAAGTSQVIIQQSRILNSSTGIGSNRGFRDNIGIDVYIENSIFNGVDSSTSEGIFENQAAGTLYVYNSVIANWATGIYIQNTSNLDMYNTLLYSNTDALSAATSTNTGGYNATTEASDSELPCTGTTCEFSITSADVETEGTGTSGDWTPAAGSDLLETGYDINTNSPNVSWTDDIIGTTRPQSTLWDIGAFEKTAGATTTTTLAPRRTFFIGQVLYDLPQYITQIENRWTK